MSGKRIVIVTDAWSPQINGVVQTLTQVKTELEHMGHSVHMIHPGLFHTIPCPTYPEIRLALFKKKQILRILKDISPHHIHIAIFCVSGTYHRRQRNAMLKHYFPNTDQEEKIPIGSLFDGKQVEVLFCAFYTA